MINIELSHQDASKLIAEQMTDTFKQAVSVLIRPLSTVEGFKVFELNEFFTEDQWKELLKNQHSNKIKLIKIVRALSGKGLAECKAFVEQYI